MQFDINFPKSIKVQRGVLRKLAEILQQKNYSSVLVVTDKGVLNAGLLNGLIENFKNHKINHAVFSDVVADPPESIILEVTEAAKKVKADCVVAIGGGSSMDAAKLAAVLALGQEKLSDIYGIGNIKGARLPLILVPTTAGTGSEVTTASVVTISESEKRGVLSPVLIPDLALLDAELTLGLPPAVTAATGIDAMVHAIEAYTSKHLKNPISDTFARDALKLLAGSISEAVKNGSNIEARERMLWGACLAGMSFSNSPVAAVHALAYPIGARFHVPHGLSNSLMLPGVLKFNAETSCKEYAELADVIFGELNVDDKQKTAILVDYFTNLPASLGLPTKLREVGIKESDVEQLAKDVMLQTRLLGNNPREVDYEAALALYKEAY
jgi:alcohol dehydrogenase class IV